MKTLTISGLRGCGHVYHVDVPQRLTDYEQVRARMGRQRAKPCEVCKLTPMQRVVRQSGWIKGMPIPHG